MSTRFVIKRDSGGRPTEGGLRLPGQDASDRPDQPTKSIALKTGLRQTSEGRITKSKDPTRNRKRHGNTSLSKVPASKARGLEGPTSKKLDEGSLHGISSLDKRLARPIIREAPKTPVSEPSMEPVATEFFGFDPNDPYIGGFKIAIRDNIRSDADAATPTIQPSRTPGSVQDGITSDHSHSNDASFPALLDEKHVPFHSNTSHGKSQRSHHGESAAFDADRIPLTEPAASIGL